MRVKGSVELAKKARKSSTVQLGPLTNAATPIVTNKQCQHLTKSINQLSILRKHLKDIQIGECTSCLEAKKKSPEFEINKETSLWLCLYCGHFGCDRSSECQHAIKHFKTPRSVTHCICLNTDTWMIWCYECDNEITQISKSLEEIIIFIKKLINKSSTEQQLIVSNIPDIPNTFIETKAKQPLPPIPRKLSISNDKGNLAQQINQSSASLNKVNGLSNLGNTCFFNAVLQNLAQTPNLESLLSKNTSNKDKIEVIQTTSIDNDLSESDKDDTSASPNELRKIKHSKNDQLTIHIAEPGAMTYSLCSILREMGSSRGTMSPGALFSLVCKKVPSFRGFQQQDSHELLRHLLDALKAEEIRRRQAGILSALNFQQKTSISDLLKQKIRAFGRAVDYTFIDSLFGGHLLSSIYCEQCKTCSQNIEPFLDLSLPIVDEKKAFNSIQQHQQQGAQIINDSSGLSKNQIKRQRQLARKSKNRKITKKIDSNHQQTTQNDNEDVENDELSDELDDYSSDDDQNYLNSIEKSLNDHIYDTNEYKLEAMQTIKERNLILNGLDENTLSSSIQSCLLQFTSPELLTGTNKFGCETCTKLHSRKNGASDKKTSSNTVYTDAKKQYLICELPAVLTIHLKRFQQNGFRLEKLSKHVSFPFELDMSPYTSKMCVNLTYNSSKALYSLYGIVEHSGRLNGGHYTAYVKCRQKPNLDKFLGKKRIFSLKPSTIIDDLMDTVQAINNSNSNESNYSWYYVSDSQVQEVHESKITKVQAYILFYERIV